MRGLDGAIVQRHLTRDVPQILLDRRDRLATDLASRRQILLTIVIRENDSWIKHGFIS